jgi:intein/homing endonuclease
MRQIVDCFHAVNDKISSDNNDLVSNDVLALLRPYFEEIGFDVETGKSKDEKIDVPVLFGVDNRIDKSFYADALSQDGRIVIEVEAGQATENHRFLKDIFEASMMFDVEYLVLAVRNKYRTHNDFERVFTFLETLYISNRLHLPLKGILLIGY